MKPEGLGLPSWEKVQIQVKYQAPSQANVWELTAPPLAGENKANGKSSGCQIILIRQVTYANVSRVNSVGRSRKVSEEERNSVTWDHTTSL